ncbi:hypothetical protein ACLB1G_21985 [Oxalobacteraceae bacterium A2-2]
MMARLRHLQIFAAPAVFWCSCMLAGCATRPPAPVEVKVPVVVPCVTTVPARPVYEFDRLPATASDGEKVLAPAKDWLRSRRYEAELEAALDGCSQVK